MRSSFLIIIEDGSSTSTLHEAFPWDTAPRYLLRNRDTSYGIGFRDRVRAMNIEEVVTAPRLPWQNPYVERIIGSIRRECLDYVIIFNATQVTLVDDACIAQQWPDSP